ncbi:MAG: hypothetical protein JWQ72_3127 [Polaromonas sp.]|nr:hypothetical protein [Polaromonas sp.]
MSADTAAEGAGGAAAGDIPPPPPVLESAAFPPLVRALAAAMVLGLAGFALWSWPALSTTAWSTASLGVYGGAFICIVWVGYWILRSRTRLEGDVLTQTWLWTKRERAADVAQLKLVHWRWLESIMAPRLLVRRRNGAITWFNAADARLLTAFAEQVARRSLPPLAS